MEIYNSTTKNLAILASGNGSNAQAIIDACIENYIPAKVLLVVSNNSKAKVLDRAEKANIQTLVTSDYALLEKQFKEKMIDGVILAGYLKILPANFIRSFQNKIINIHPSLIPAFSGMNYYGEKVHQAVYARGVRFTGATTHFVNEYADEGPIIFQEIVEISEKDNAVDIQKKVLEKEHPLLIKTVKYFCEDRLTIKDDKVYVEE